MRTSRLLSYDIRRCLNNCCFVCDDGRIDDVDTKITYLFLRRVWCAWHMARRQDTCIMILLLLLMYYVRSNNVKLNDQRGATAQTSSTNDEWVQFHTTTLFYNGPSLFFSLTFLSRTSFSTQPNSSCQSMHRILAFFYRLCPQHTQFACCTFDTQAPRIFCNGVVG